MAFVEYFDKMLCTASTARSNHRDAHRIGDGFGQLAIEAGSRAVTIHRGQQDFSCASRLRVSRPFQGIAPRWCAAAVGKRLPASLADSLRIDSHNNCLGTKTLSDAGDETGVGEGGRVNADLVGSGGKDRRSILQSTN